MRYLTRDEWEFYAELRSERGIERANRFKSRAAKHNGPMRESKSDFSCIHVDEDGTSWVEKMFIPDRHFDSAQKLEVERDLEIKINSPYDCTGRPFSWAVDVFNVANGAWVYRHMGLDV